MIKINYNIAVVFYICFFVICSVASVFFYQPYILIVPFLLLLAQVLIEFAIKKPFYLFLFTIFCLPLSVEWQVTPSLSLDFPTEPLLMLILYTCIAKWLYNYKSFPAYLLSNKLFFILILHVLWLMINIGYSSHPILSLKFFIAKLWYVIPLVMALQNLVISFKQVKQIFFVLLTSMIFVVLQSLLRHASFLFSFEGIKYTLYPFFRNHVNYSATLVLLLPYLIIFKPFVTYKNEKPKITFQVLFVILLVTGLFFAFSRGAWLAFILAFLASYIFRIYKIKLLIFSSICILAIGLMVIFHKNAFLKLAPDYNTTIYHQRLSDHLQATVTLKDVSNAERIYRWVAGLQMTSEHPLVGFGTNTFYYHYKNYTIKSFETWVSSNKDHSTVHNYFLLTFIEQGVIGLFLLLSIFIFALLKAQYLYKECIHKTHKQLAIVLGLMLIMIIVLNFLSDLIETDKVGGLFWLCIGLLIWLDKNRNSAIIEPKPIV